MFFFKIPLDNLFKRVYGLLKERAWKYWRGPRLRKTEVRERFLDTRRALNPGTHNNYGAYIRPTRSKQPIFQHGWVRGT